MKAKWHELDRRINEQDYTAFTEAIDLPGSMAARFLWIYAHSDGWDPQARPKALEAIKRTHGFKEYYQQQLAEMADKNEYPLRVQEILIAIGNDEAAAVIAANLFECGTLTADGKVSGKVLNQNAAWVLGKMNFPDAPTTGDPHQYGPDENIAWQKWAIAHGMVPKDWESRVGVPEWQYRMDPNMKRRQARGGRPPRNSESQGLPDPADATRVWPPKPGMTASNLQQTSHDTSPSASATIASKVESSFAGWERWAGVASVLASVAAWLLLRARKPRL